MSFHIGFVVEEGRFKRQVKLERIGTTGQKYESLNKNNQRKLILYFICFESQPLIIQTDSRELLPDNLES